MSNIATNWILSLVDRISGPSRAAQGQVDALGETVRRVSAIDIHAMGSAFRNLSGQIDSISEPGARFDAQVKDLSAITGATGKQLDELSDSARKSAKVFGGDASQQMESYKTVLSRLGPDLAKAPAAIDGMGNHIQTLSKTMKNDAVGATDALTTAMLQYQVDLSDPIKATEEAGKMMNVMAAGAKYGAAEVPQISAALAQTGVQAKLAKLSFEETNAAIQALATGGKYGAEAGVALRNVLTRVSAPSSLSKEAVGELGRYGVNIRKIADAAVPWADRLKELAPIQNDINALSAVFGTENAANAQILIRTAQSQQEMTTAITGTNTATEQAAIVMSSSNEQAARRNAWNEDLKISFFNLTKSILPYVSGASQAIAVLADLKNAQLGVKMIMDGLRASTILQTIATGAATVATTVFNAVLNMNPIAKVVLVVSALTAGVVYAYKHFETFRGIIHGTWEAMKEFGNVIYDLVIGRIKELISGIAGIGKSLYKLFTGEFSEAAEAGKQALLDIGGVGTMQKAMEGGQRIAGAYRTGFDGQITKVPTLSQRITEGLNQSTVLEAMEKMGIRGGAKYLEGYMSQVKKIALWMDRIYNSNVFSSAINRKIEQFTSPTASSNATGTTGTALGTASANAALPPVLGGIPKTPKGSGGSGNGLSIAGGGSKSVSMHVEIKNYFNVASGLDARKIAEDVSAIIDARLRDSAVALL